MDFLSFKSFISIGALITFYYIGAIILPVAGWLLAVRLIRKYNFVEAAYAKGKESLWKMLNVKQRTMLFMFFLSLFFFMELFWRIMFEYLIAYMQIRDALLQS